VYGFRVHLHKCHLVSAFASDTKWAIENSIRINAVLDPEQSLIVRAEEVFLPILAVVLFVVVLGAAEGGREVLLIPCRRGVLFRRCAAPGAEDAI